MNKKNILFIFIILTFNSFSQLKVHYELKLDTIQKNDSSHISVESLKLIKIENEKLNIPEELSGYEDLNCKIHFDLDQNCRPINIKVEMDSKKKKINSKSKMIIEKYCNEVISTATFTFQSNNVILKWDEIKNRIISLKYVIRINIE